MRSTIFFYTNNFLSRNILYKTLSSAINHCIENDVELIITSHYPLIDNYEKVDSSSFSGFNNELFNNYLQKDLIVNTKGAKVRNYVFGKQPYIYATILKQLCLSCSKCETENAILFEHDCLYPTCYIKTVESKLMEVDMTYCKENYSMIYESGFLKCIPHVFLSSFSAKNHVFNKVFNHKLDKVLNKSQRVTMLEPAVRYNRVIIPLPNAVGSIKKALVTQTKATMHLPSMDVSLSQECLDEVLTENAICIDEYLGDDNCILEFQHGLNTTNSLELMRKVMTMSDNKQYIDQLSTHNYWGTSDHYTQLIDYRVESEMSKRILYNGLHSVDGEL